MSPDESDDEATRLTEFVKSEVALINGLIKKVLGPDATHEQREDMKVISLAYLYGSGKKILGLTDEES